MQKKPIKKEIFREKLSFRWDDEAAQKTRDMVVPRKRQDEAQSDANEYFQFLEQFTISNAELLNITVFDEVFVLGEP